MKEMTLDRLIIYLMEKHKDYDLTIRVHEGKKYIVVGIDTDLKEEPNEGDKNTHQTT